MADNHPCHYRGIPISPCPYCHNDESMDVIEIGLYAVECENCCAVGPKADSKQAAIREWNKAKIAEDSTVTKHPTPNELITAQSYFLELARLSILGNKTFQSAIWRAYLAAREDVKEKS